MYKSIEILFFALLVEAFRGSLTFILYILLFIMFFSSLMVIKDGTRISLFLVTIITIGRKSLREIIILIACFQDLINLFTSSMEVVSFSNMLWMPLLQ
jgi:hypothetical protein